MRTHFEEQMQHLNEALIDMGALCEEGISACTKALLNTDEATPGMAKAIERDIDQKERDIETQCLRLLLQQQPVARDLRLISAAMKMISDMERIGDQASDIEEITKYIGNDMDIRERLRFGDMAKATIDMVTDAVNSFVKKDIALARSVIDCDDIVDDQFNTTKKDLIRMISEGDTRGELLLDLMMIAKYFEKIGDHATNIAEWVVYSITGSHPKLGSF
jgi:phosphate transport system protein